MEAYSLDEQGGYEVIKKKSYIKQKKILIHLKVHHLAKYGNWEKMPLLNIKKKINIYGICVLKYVVSCEKNMFQKSLDFLHNINI